MSQSAALSQATADLKKRRIQAHHTLRLIPFIFICYLFNYLDRVNVGFAKLQMLDALKFSETIYGPRGPGIFFIGYVLCGVPSNLALTRFGPRRWIALMMITWGVLSTCLLFVSTPTQFYTLRLFTGAAEAGFFPGVVLYPLAVVPELRAAGWIMALFMSAIPVFGPARQPFLRLDPQPLCRRPGRSCRLAVDVPVARDPDHCPGHCGVFSCWRTNSPTPSG